MQRECLNDLKRRDARINARMAMMMAPQLGVGERKEERARLVQNLLDRQDEEGEMGYIKSMCRVMHEQLNNPFYD